MKAHARFERRRLARKPRTKQDRSSVKTRVYVDRVVALFTARIIRDMNSAVWAWGRQVKRGQRRVLALSS